MQDFKVMKYPKIVVLLFLLMAGIFSSCEEETEVSTSLVTEEVLYLSGEKIRLLGRILTTSQVSGLDHGFLISDNPGFTSPKMISLGVRENPGRFIGESDVLEMDKKYYAKAFLELPSGFLYGNILEVQTLTAAAEDLSPNNGKAGLEIFILGKNFPKDARVFFGTNEGQVIGIDFESRIRVRVPAAAAPVVQVRVLAQGREFVVPTPFEYTIGTYQKLGDFPLGDRIYNNVYFQQGADFYVGSGTLRSNNFNEKFWKLSGGQGNWEEVTFSGRPLWMAFATANYYGSGASVLGRAPFTIARDFWTINQSGQFQRMPDLPFDQVNAIAFQTGNTLFVTGGDNGFGFETFRYDPISGTWSRVSNAPFRLHNRMMHFTYAGKFYVVNPDNREIFSYNPETDNWDFFQRYPGLIGGVGGFGAVVGDRVYLGLENRSTEIWELNMQTLNWAAKNSFTGNPLASNAGVFVNNGLIYILRSNESQLPAAPMEFWVFDPKGF